ncbi:hypothetical protein GCM10023317_73990 [Actinopolymorpha pittospori]
MTCTALSTAAVLSLLRTRHLAQWQPHPQHQSRDLSVNAPDCRREARALLKGGAGMGGFHYATRKAQPYASLTDAPLEAVIEAACVGPAQQVMREGLDGPGR